MEASGERGDSRFNLAYNMNLLSGEPQTDLYSQSAMGRGPSTSVQQIINSRHSIATSVCGIHSARGTPSGLKVSPDGYDEHRGMSSQNIGMDPCTVTELDQDSYTSMQPKKSPPSNGKKTKGRVKIKMEYIENKLRRYTTFSKRKTGIMKKAYELSTLTGTQVMLLVASETGHVYTFATRKLQPMITSEAGKELIQMCLNSPDPMGSTGSSGPSGADQRMSATGFEETELTYNISDDDSKDEAMSPMGDSSDSCSEEEACSVPPEYIQTNLLDYKGVLAAANSNNNSKPSSASKKPTHTTQPNSSSNNNSISTTAVTTNALPSGLKVYQTAQGTIYATTTTPNASGTSTGVLLSLQESRSGNQPHFITIPLQVTADNKPRQSPKTNDTKELDLSTKSNNVNVTVSVAARK